MDFVHCVGIMQTFEASDENLDINKFTENKSFWKVIKPLFNEKQIFHNNVTRVENEEIISRDPQVAEILNRYFSNIVKDLDIEGYKVDDDLLFTKDHISNITAKHKDHPSILKIKENVVNYKNFSLV